MGGAHIQLYSSLARRPGSLSFLVGARSCWSVQSDGTWWWGLFSCRLHLRSTRCIVPFIRDCMLHVSRFVGEYRMCVVSFCTLCRRNVGSSCSARCKITGGTCRSVLHSAWCAILCLFLHHDFISTLWFAASNQGVCCMILWWFLWDRSAFSAWISQATGLERLESQYLKLRSWNRWNLSISSYGAGIGGIWVSQATGLERLDFEYLKLRGWNG